MKTKLILSAILVSLTFYGAAQNDKEVAAIKAVIEKETSSFLNVDRKGWDDSWMHVPYAYWSYSDSTGTNFLEGWDAVSRYFDEYFRTQQSSRQIDVAHQSETLIVERAWKEIRVYGNGAFAHYIQKVKDKNIYRDETSQIRIMEKKDGKWKVVCVGAIASYPKE